MGGKKYEPVLNAAVLAKACLKYHTIKSLLAQSHKRKDCAIETVLWLEAQCNTPST